MRRILVLFVLALSYHAYAQEAKPTPTLRSILLEQLRTTHNQKEWFVPANTAVEGLTPEQASWQDGKGNHSIGQLTNHLVFWNQEELAKFKGEPPVKFSGDNNETFNNFDSKKWAATVQQLDQVMTDWEKAVGSCGRQETRIVVFHHRAHRHAQRVPHRTDHLYSQAAGLLGPGEGSQIDWRLDAPVSSCCRCGVWSLRLAILPASNMAAYAGACDLEAVAERCSWRRA